MPLEERESASKEEQSIYDVGAKSERHSLKMNMLGR